ncbi:CBO0543 family protein [Bacillus salipaludis]|uniref:CBO0543 family protein n=1 Tax=Bacillus salipaludis TaxID=2547811 RepID=UPI003D1A0EB1
MIRFVFGCVFWIVIVYLGDWRNWKQFHLTILFMIAGDFMVSLITYNHTLWDLSSELGGDLLNNFFLAFVVYPPTVLLYLSHYPNRKRLISQIFYIAFAGIVYTFIELIEYFFHNIHYHNGWSIWKSLLLNFGMFTVLKIHSVKPFLAYALFFIEVILLILICQIPISKFK